MGQRDSVTADPVSGQTTALLATFGRVWTQAEDQEPWRRLTRWCCRQSHKDASFLQ